MTAILKAMHVYGYDIELYFQTQYSNYKTIFADYVKETYLVDKFIMSW